MSNELEAFFGLPQEVKFCKKCVMSNQRPMSEVEFKHSIDTKKRTMNFDENGVCDACNTAEIKENIDWDQREKELITLLDKYRKTDGSYDCLVPGSGGKDSAFQSHISFDPHMAPHSLYRLWLQKLQKLVKCRRIR